LIRFDFLLVYRSQPKPKMIITGTSYFPTLHDAYMYYANLSIEQVAYKIKLGEIHLGKPVLKAGETLFIKDNRYFIQSEN